MCRMLAVVSLKPFSTRYLQDFRRLAEHGKVSGSAVTWGHKDGWGIVHIEDQPVYLGRRAFLDDGAVEANAAESKEYGRVCADIEEKGLRGVFLAHLRKASSGLKTRGNTAPFIEGGWAFAHNGTVSTLGSGEVSDSRVLFKMLVEKITERRDTVEGVRTVVKKIRGEHTYSSMTLLLSGNRSLYAYRDYARDEDYYALKYAYADDSTLIFSQEDIWNLNWFTIPNRRMVIAGKDLEIEGPLEI